jgi:formylglycine-generating enzyme required for sulfatase activity
MTDLDSQLAFLRVQRDAAPNASSRAMFEQLIATLEQQAPTAEAHPSRAHILHIREYTSIQAAIAGDVHGDIYIVGERSQSTKVLLAGYLRWLASQCGQLPLRGVREQKNATDVLNIGLDQVYTQLATTDQLERERIVGEALVRFDAAAYLAAHQGSERLPFEQRTTVQRHHSATPHLSERMTRELEQLLAVQPDQALRGRDTTLFEGLDAASLSRMANGADAVTIFGPQLVTEAIAHEPRLVLLGEPGSGKSTALRYLALTLARAGLDDTLDLSGKLEGWQTLGTQGQLIPLFMPLLPMAKHLAGQPGRNGTAADLWNAIDTHLTQHGATPDVVTAIRAELARGHVLLLLDGLDEVAGGDSRRQVIDTVQAFATEQPQCRMVVSCRVRAYEGHHNVAWQLPGWPTVTLADWTPGQVRAFIDAWYVAAAAASQMPDTKRDERSAAFKRAIDQREDLKRLSIRPLLLTIMALVHLNDSELPEDRVSLYVRCLDILLGQWEIAGKEVSDYGTLMRYIGLPDAIVKSLRPLLARAAYAAQDVATPGEVGRLRRADLRVLVADGLEQLKHPNPHEGAKRFLEYTDVRSGLLQASEAGDAYTFPHQTFQECLAGLELISGVDFVDRIMARRTDDRWQVPIFLGVGHLASEGAMAMPHQLLSRLLHAKGRDEAQHQRDLIFAAELAEDVGWNRLEQGGAEFAALREDLAKALAGVVEGTGLPAAERVHAGMLLGRLGDLRPGVCTLSPAMVWIQGGSFLIGSTREEAEQTYAVYTQAGFSDNNAREWADSEINERLITVTRFEIARYLVTNAQYALFMADDGYDVQQPWWEIAGKNRLRGSKKTQPADWNAQRFGIVRPNYPVVSVTWYEAMAFCRWLTHKLDDSFIYTLPSEAEWEYAARGTARRVYPWGDQEPGNDLANFNQLYGGTTAVGCFTEGATTEGVHDLAGNVWEWTRSEYRPYPYDLEDGREGLDDLSHKKFTLRGGGWNSGSLYLRAPFRNHGTPAVHRSVGGFRLARHPKV